MSSPQPVVVVAGATGNLGGRIATALVARGATVRALVRPGTAAARTAALRECGVDIVEVDLDNDAKGLVGACAGASCVVSALLGLHDVMVETQTRLLEAAVGAGVPRFIPSDFSIDFTTLPPGQNRNLDLHRLFQQRVDASSSVAPTSILNGAFMELLQGPMPLIQRKIRRIIYWTNPDQLLDFTTIDDTAAYTVAAALDPTTPRFLRIAGSQVSARDLTVILGELTGEKYRLQSAGGLPLLKVMIAAMRALSPASTEPFPPWQGMQYTHNMFSGSAYFKNLDNDRYPDLTFTSARTLLKASL